jgi:hypothetical protein
MRINLVAMLKLSAIMFLTSCSIINVHDSSGKTETTTHLGYVSVVLPESQDGYLVKMKGVGAFGFGADFSVGYVDLNLAGLNPSCHVVFWAENEEQEKRIKSILGEMQGVCIVGQSTINHAMGDRE